MATTAQLDVVAWDDGIMRTWLVLTPAGSGRVKIGRRILRNGSAHGDDTYNIDELKQTLSTALANRSRHPMLTWVRRPRAIRVRRELEPGWHSVKPVKDAIRFTHEPLRFRAYMGFPFRHMFLVKGWLIDCRVSARRLLQAVALVEKSETYGAWREKDAEGT